MSDEQSQLPSRVKAMANSTTAAVISRLGMPILATVASFVGLMMLDRLHTIDGHIDTANAQINQKVDQGITQVNAKIDEVRKDQHDIALAIWNDLKQLNKDFQDEKVYTRSELAGDQTRIRTLEATGQHH